MSKRKRPEGTWLSRTKYEIEHSEEILEQKLKELKEIRKKKEEKK